MTLRGPLLACGSVLEGNAPLTVLGETAYPPSAASARVRLVNHVPFLREHGIRLEYHPGLTDSEYALLASQAGVVAKASVLLRSALRATQDRLHETGSLLLVHRLRSLSPLPGFDPPRRLDIYDLDDALFLSSPAEVNRGFQWVKQEARRCIVAMRRARLVIAGNQYLASNASTYARYVEVVPSCVDPDHQTVHEHTERDVLTLGWIGSHTTTSFLQPLLPVLSTLNRERIRARVVVVGGDTGIREPWLEHRRWSLEAEEREISGFDIGLMPLPDTEWARGKCGYKLLQYFAAGIPAIASPVGVNPALVGSDRGLLASTPEDWRKAIERLMTSVDERRERGALARRFVEAEFSYRRWAPEIAGLFKTLAG